MAYGWSAGVNALLTVIDGGYVSLLFRLIPHIS
jgi:hypothetical protein